jgi:hypothetical protein
LIKDELDPKDLGVADRVFANRNLEEGLTRLRRIRALLIEGEKFDDLDATSALAFEKVITSAIVKHLSSDDYNDEAARNFVTWAGGEYYTRPVEVFTVNYDLLLERGFEQIGAAYFDGFVGGIAAPFRPDLVDLKGVPTERDLPAHFVRLWKLHGSLNWRIRGNRVVRTGSLVDQGDLAAIYPSDAKYDQSRRAPFVVLHDRFRNALAESETLTIIAGYSFGDEHLNEVIFDAARRFPRSEFAVLCFEGIPNALIENALPNVTVMGAAEAIVGGVRGEWREPNTGADRVWRDGRFRLGDFGALSDFLARTPRNGAQPALDPINFERGAPE